MMEVEAPLEWRDTPFIFYSSPGTLASWASSKVALICWSYEIRGVYPYEAENLDTDDDADWFIERKFSCVDICKTPLPSSIVEKIDYYIEVLGPELKKWVYNMYEITDNDAHDVMSRCIDHIIVESNGTISCKKTARNLLDNAKLNSYEKYVIACKNCFENDIERLWPSASSEFNWRIRKFDEGIYPMIYYWNGRMNNKPYQNSTSESKLMKMGVSEAWTIIEYFWNRLEPRDQKLNLSINFDWSLSSDIIKCLLPKLTSNQLARFLKSFTTRILRTLTNNEESCSHAIQVWDYLLLNVEYTQSIFFKVLEDLCKIHGDIPRKYENDNYSTFAGRRMLLRHIWSSSPDNFKNSITDRQVLKFFQTMFHSHKELIFKTYGLNMDFFLDVLTTLKYQQRNELWLQFWREFIIFAAASDLKKIMELCLPKDDIVEFKKRMVDYDTLKQEFDLFILKGRYLELANYLKLFSSSEAEEKLVRMQIVDSNMHKMFQFDFEALKKFNRFMDGAFSSPSLANQRKEEYFRENIDNVYALLDQGLVGNVKNIANFSISHNPEYLAEIKQVFFVRCRNDLISGSFLNFNTRYWQEFIEWCSADDDFLQFKDNLPLEYIFETFSAKIVERDRGQIVFEQKDVFVPLSNFLCWYFGDRKSVKKFLSEKIAKYQQAKANGIIVPHLIELASSEMLKWYFNGK